MTPTGVSQLAKAIDQNKELAILHLIDRAETLQKRSQEILKELRTVDRNGSGFPLMSLRYSGRDPFPRIVWVYSLGKPGVRSGGKSRYTREFAKPSGYRYRARIFEVIPEPARSHILEIERDAADLRRQIKDTKAVIKFAKEYIT